MGMIDEIYEFVLPELKANGFEDSVENRIAALQGLNDAWREDTDFHPRKPFYIMACALEIQRLTVALNSRV